MKWFQHDTQSNRNSKLEKVLLKYGAHGYALYWLCLELIADRIDYRTADFELHHDAEILAARLKIQQTEVEEIMLYMVKLELFEESNGVITCLRMADMIVNSIVKNPQIKALQEKIRDNPGKIRDNSGKVGLHDMTLHDNTIHDMKENTPGADTAPPAAKIQKKALKNFEAAMDTSEYSLIIAEFYRLHEEKTGAKPLIDAKTGKIIKDLMKLQTSAVINTKLEKYYGGEWWFTKNPDGSRSFSIGNFRQHFDEIPIVKVQESMKKWWEGEK